MLRAQRADGTVVRAGDLLTDFRGKAWTFVAPSRASEPGRSGKVTVAATGATGYAPGSTREMYCTVFSLTVIDT
jgi:hypothetical protein